MSYLNAYNVGSQTLAVGDVITFTTNDLRFGGCCNGLTHSAGTGVISIATPGVYQIEAAVTATATAAGTVGIQLYNGSDIVAGAAATQTVAEAGTVTLGIAKLIRVRPSCMAIANSASLSLQLTGGAAVVTNANILIHQIA